MSLEAVTHISDLDINNPVGASDPKSQGDDHIRNIKSALKTDFPNINGAVTGTPAELNGVVGSAAVEAITVDTAYIASQFNFLPAVTKITAPADGVPVLLTLPAVSGVTAGKRRRFYNNSLGNVQLVPNGTDTIAGTNANYRIPSRTSIELLSDGISEWMLGKGPEHFIGQMIEFAVATAPLGFVPCDGAAISRTGNAGLFNVAGTTFGVGDGSTTFNVPAMARRTVVGSGGSGTGTLGNAIGNTGGEENHQLTVPELASHTHTKDIVRGVWQSNASSNTNEGVWGTDNTGATGGDQGHNTIQPSLVMAFYIKT